MLVSVSQVRTRRRRSVMALALALALGGLTLDGSAEAAPAEAAPADPAAINVTVNAREGLGVVPDTAYGLNQAVWDTNMNTPASVDLLGRAGVRMMRYPGGSYGDGYHWQTNTVSGGGYVAPGTDFDSFMHTTQAIGAQAILIANYGSGTPDEAAGWVRYANLTKHYGVRYWEIGNEIFGNGYYGADWELDYHDSKSATTYANLVVQYAAAMKAVDPTIKIGAVVTDPGNWPDGVVGAADTGDWNRTVLSIAGPAIDFAIMHYYPSHTTAADVLQQTKLLPGELAQLRQKIDRYAGPNAAGIGIAVTETASNYQSDTQVGGLFAADVYFTALENGVFNIDYWNTRNGMPDNGVTTAPDGTTSYGDGGMISSGNCNSDGVCEPPLNTPFAPYHALQMLSNVARPGDTLVRAGSDNALLAVHAARNTDGGLSVELLNQDPVTAHTVSLHYDGWTPSTATPTVYSFGPRSTAITTAQQGTAGSQIVPPYSIVTVKLRPSPTNPVATALSAPGTPTATAVTATSATVSWRPSAGGPVTRYAVYQQFGTNSILLGDTTATSFTARNLTPGTAYTLNVLATDASGYLSPPSPPVTFTTGTPATSTCAVTYDISGGWGSGFVASITVTNTGPTPVTGWTLAFALPATTESVSGSTWNATFAVNGQNVVVTPAAYNATLAANAANSASFGFIGNQTGANPPPTSFTLNGTVCATTYSP
ncbi:cellulose binding domain-containing protein [Dactylosporangium matsuzakiense]|uniref:Alpha-L-arabinofuranosidase n=1 Tax=Dactylosporangium matsuzakiense TaxID=53360 RepID=A0A9W6KV63_9ACTN|nr:cellulose binding domain-containing protein [Dactylosporangium matsuzakiense]GLL07878.1 alpha-L-arabinofuranosidase [Dactylosporangium matsuzakiense]